MIRYAAVLSTFFLGCAAAGVEPAVIETGKTFSLRVGESAQAHDATLRVGFVGVSADSRCPRGEQCVWAGDATVRIWLQRAAGMRESRELHTATSALQGAYPRDAEVQLVRLDPVPVAGRALVPGDYVATLVLTRGAPATPDR